MLKYIKELGRKAAGNKKHIIVMLIVFVLFFLFAVDIYYQNVQQGPVKQLNKKISNFTPVLEEGDRLVQTLNVDLNDAQALYLYFGTFDNSLNGSGSIQIQLMELKTKKILASDELDTRMLYDSMYYEFEIPEMDLKANDTALVINAEKLDKKATISLFTGDSNSSILTKPVEYNGRELSEALRMDYRVGEHSFVGQLILYVLVLLAFILLAGYFLIVVKKIDVWKAYLAAVLALGILYIYMLPTYMTPDEETHLFKAYEISNALLGYNTDPEHFELRQCEADVYQHLRTTGTYITRNSYRYYHEMLQTGDDNGTLTEIEHMVISTPRYQYVPSALGITIGRLLNLNACKTMTLGMLFNFGLYVALTVLAIRLIPVGKAAAAIICLLPISLQQATSYSYDSIVMPLGLLFCASLIKMSYEEELSKKTFVILALSALFFVPTKNMAYIPVLLLLVLAAWRKRKNKKQALSLGLLFAGVLITTVVIMMITSATAPKELDTVEYPVPFVEWANQPGYTISMLLEKPLDTLGMIWNTFYEKGEFYVETTFGGLLGWMEAEVSAIAVYTCMIASIIAVMPKSNETMQLKSSQRIGFFIVFVLCAACVVGGMLLEWTPVSRDYVEGVQGRYFLPVFLLALFAFRGKGITISQRVERGCLYAAIAIQPFAVAGIIQAL